ncbi:MAG: hypothetical protein HOP24_07770 [Sideroxydans sp.]|nr:hypothetical protein [Sideroxydans sp.]
MKAILNRYCCFVERHSSNGEVALALLLLILAVAGMSSVVRQFVVLMNGTLPLDITLFYGLAQAKSFFEEIPEEAAQYYLSMVAPADVLFPLAYGVLFGFIVARLLSILKRGGNPAPRGLIAYSLIPAVIDYWENAGFVAALANGREVSETLLFTTMIASGLKWFFALAGFAILAWLIVRVMVVVRGERK